MNGNRITRIGLAAVAALTIAAVLGAGTAAASPAGFTAESYPATLSGTPYTTLIETNYGSYNYLCGESGELTGKLSGPSATLSANVGDSKCSIGLEMNGCGYAFAIENTSFGGSSEIGPSGCGPVIVNGGIEMFPQTGNGTLSVSTGGSEIIITSEITGVKYAQEGSYIRENGRILRVWHVSAQDSEGNPTGLHAEEDHSIGMYMESSEGGPVFGFEQLPATIFGEDNALEFSLPGWGSLGCANYESPQTSYSMDAFILDSISVCKAFGVKSTADMHGCKYYVHTSSAGPPYAGNVGIACPEGVAGITYTTPLECSVTIPPQEFGTATYETQGSGSHRQVYAEAGGTNLDYEICGSAGENGTFKWRTTFGARLFS